MIAVVAATAALIGLIVGLFLGRSTADSIGDRIGAVRSDARATADTIRALRGTSSDDAALADVQDELAHQFHDAPWIGAAERDDILARLTRLRQSKAGAAFGARADQLARAIDVAFGVT